MSAGRASFPLPKNIENLRDPRTALRVRSGREVTRDAVLRDLNAALGTRMTLEDVATLLEVVALTGRQAAHPNLRRGSHKSVVGLYAALHRVHRNTARKRLRTMFGLPVAPRRTLPGGRDTGR